MSQEQFDQETKFKIVESSQEVGIKEAAKIAGVHYTTVYEWKRQIEAMGEEAFMARNSPHPGRGVKQISLEQEEAVLETVKAHPGFGPGQVRNALRRQGKTLSIRTVRRLMEANGYQAAGKKEQQQRDGQRFEAERPLELAQMDILELFINKLKVYLILLIDDFSRFILGYRLLEETSIDAVIALVGTSITRFGKMEELLTDRGFVFYSWRGVNRLESYLESRRIDQTHARPHHPQTLGKVEALNRRIQSELFARERFSTVQQACQGLDQWVDHYNYRRPHQGLGGLLTPAERFHGQAEKVLDDIAQGCDVTVEGRGIERSLFNVVLAGDGKITLYLLGRPVMVVPGGCHE
jgi:transposase InsO family protein